MNQIEQVKYLPKMELPIQKMDVGFIVIYKINDEKAIVFTVAEKGIKKIPTTISPRFIDSIDIQFKDPIGGLLIYNNQKLME